MTRRRLLIAAAVVLAAFMLAAAGAYVFEVRRRQSDAAERAREREAQAQELSRHREAQRAASPPPAAAPGAPPPAAVAPPYWTDFRGPLRDGHYRERPIHVSWPATGLPPLWMQPVGGGHSSFSVAHGRAFTLEQRGRLEVIAAYDVATGRELWTQSWEALFSEYYGGEGPRSTPVWHDGRVHALGAQGELRVVSETDGRVIWRANILEDAGESNLQWGVAASPLVTGDAVFVAPGGPGRLLTAYERTSGRRLWSSGTDRAAYSSPMRATLAGVEQIVLLSATKLTAFAPDDGRVLWEHPWPTHNGINASQPLILGGNRVFLSSGYGMGAAVIEVARTGDAWSAREMWRNTRMKNQFTSSVQHDGFVYGLDEAILACIDAATGDVKWKAGRYGHGQIMLAGGHIIVLTETGELALVRATPERHVELARFQVLDGRTWNHPAIADGILLIRGGREMAAFDLRR